MEPTNTQLEAMEAMEAQYKQNMAQVEELEAKMYADGEIEVPNVIDPNGPEEMLDTPETTTEIFSGDPITCPVENKTVEYESPEYYLASPENRTFLSWLSHQDDRTDEIGDLARNVSTDTDFDQMEIKNFDTLKEHLFEYNEALEALFKAKTEFEDFEDEIATHLDEQHMLGLQKMKITVGPSHGMSQPSDVLERLAVNRKHVGC